MQWERGAESLEQGTDHSDALNGVFMYRTRTTTHSRSEEKKGVLESHPPTNIQPKHVQCDRVRCCCSGLQKAF